MSEVTPDLGAALGMLLRVYSERVNGKLAAVPQGSRGYQTLSEVVQGRPPSQAALAARLGIDRTMMTYLIDDLVDAGLVERRPDPDDRRRHRIVATDRGHDAITALCGHVGEAEKGALAGLDGEERALFRSLLDKASGYPLHGVDACAVADKALKA